MEKTTVYYTKEIIGGPLNGMRFIESISYPTIQDCVDFIRAGQKGFKTPKSYFGLSKGWIIVDHSFQNYAR